MHQPDGLHLLDPFDGERSLLKLDAKALSALSVSARAALHLLALAHGDVAALLRATHTSLTFLLAQHSYLAYVHGLLPPGFGRGEAARGGQKGAEGEQRRQRAAEASLGRALRLHGGEPSLVYKVRVWLGFTHLLVYIQCRQGFRV